MFIREKNPEILLDIHSSNINIYISFNIEIYYIYILFEVHSYKETSFQQNEME